MSLKTKIASALPDPVYRRIRRRRVQSLVRGFDQRQVVHQYGGHTFTVVLDDPLAEGWYDRDWPELEEVRVLRERGTLGPGATVLDVGAHQSVVAMMLAREVSPGGRIVAVEGEKHNVEVSNANITLNGIGNVEVLHAAAAAVSGTIPFAEGLNGSVDTKTSLGRVRAVTVDELRREYGAPTLVFLDIEGYEGKALEGAQETLKARESAWFVEVHVDVLVEATAASVVAAFEGYEILISDATGPNGGASYVPLTGALPHERFFLLAFPPVGSE